MGTQIFTSQEFGDIRTHVDERGEPWFCLADICRVLELHAGMTKQRIDQRGVSRIDTPTYNQFGTKVMQRLVYINEKNLYKVIMRSDKPQAEGFQDWVCGEVLPAIRKHGGYMLARADEPDEVILSRALCIMQETLKRRDERIAQLQPRILYEESLGELEKFEVLLVPDTRFLSESGFAAVKRFLASGRTVITDKGSRLELPGVVKLPFEETAKLSAADREAAWRRGATRCGAP